MNMAFANVSFSCDYFEIIEHNCPINVSLTVEFSEKKYIKNTQFDYLYINFMFFLYFFQSSIMTLPGIHVVTISLGFSKLPFCVNT